MMLRAIIVFALVAAIVVPVVISEFRRLRPRAVARPTEPRAPKRVAEAKPRLRLVVNKNDMDRELAALLAQNNRKPGEGDE
jgi:flagellar biosynthesis/type III secretory pathway M-ring protein FliF/YscJ